MDDLRFSLKIKSGNKIVDKSVGRLNKDWDKFMRDINEKFFGGKKKRK